MLVKQKLMKLLKNKYSLIGLVALSSIVADQITKVWASARLATPHGNYEHSMVVTVPAEFDGATLGDFLAAELDWTRDTDVVADNYAWNGKQKLTSDSIIATDQEITLRQRHVTVIENYWDFKYARNPGAAWGLFAGRDESFRKPFFIIISIVAIIFMFYIIRRMADEHRLLLIGIGLIIGGAIGNFIDRIRFGYVIDFIDWHYHDTHWPTFNVADAVICVGVAFMLYVVLFKMKSDVKNAEKAPKKKKG